MRLANATSLRSRWLLCIAALMMLSACARPALETEGPLTGPAVRVGLLVDSTSVVLSSPNGLQLQDPESGRPIGDLEGGSQVTIRTSTETADLVLVRGGTNNHTGLRAVSAFPIDGDIIHIAGKPYRGSALVRSTEPGLLTATNRVEMEDYLLGVVPREIGNVGDDLLETAKAQAIAARTYAVRYLGRRDSLGFDVFATVQDQVYGGVEAEHGPVSRGVRATAGEILTFNGEPIEAFYSSTCAGHTASIHKVWATESPRAYLTSVSDINPASGEAFCRSSNRFDWTQRWSIPEITEILSRTLADSLPATTNSVGILKELRILERTPEGRISALSIATSVDTFLVGGDQIRWIFRRPDGSILNSAKFDIAVLRDGAGSPREVVALGGGWGHGIGMCQVGAMGRARAGQNYRIILQAYYQGAVLQNAYGTVGGVAHDRLQGLSR